MLDGAAFVIPDLSCLRASSPMAKLTKSPISQGVVVRISGEYRTEEASSRSSWLLAIPDRQLEVETFAVDVPYSNRDRRRVGPAFPPSPALAPAFQLALRNQDGVSDSVDDLEGNGGANGSS